MRALSGMSWRWRWLREGVWMQVQCQTGVLGRKSELRWHNSEAAHMKMKGNELFVKGPPWKMVAFTLEKHSSLCTNLRAWGHTALETPEDLRRELSSRWSLVISVHLLYLSCVWGVRLAHPNPAIGCIPPDPAWLCHCPSHSPMAPLCPQIKAPHPTWLGEWARSSPPISPTPCLPHSLCAVSQPLDICYPLYLPWTPTFFCEFYSSLLPQLPGPFPIRTLVTSHCISLLTSLSSLPDQNLLTGRAVVFHFSNAGSITTSGTELQYKTWDMPSLLPESHKP